MSVKVYTASGWPFRKDIAQINKRLSDVPFIHIVSTWPEVEHGVSTPESHARDALRDTDDVQKCDVLLALFIDKEYAYRGTNFEMGYALASKKIVIAVCAGLDEEKKISDDKCSFPYSCQTNVFFYHPDVLRVKTLEEAIGLIGVIAEKMNKE